MPAGKAYDYVPEDGSQLLRVGMKGVVPQSQLAQLGSVSLQSLWVTRQMCELRRMACSF